MQSFHFFFEIDFILFLIGMESFYSVLVFCHCVTGSFARPFMETCSYQYMHQEVNESFLLQSNVHSIYTVKFGSFIY